MKASRIAISTAFAAALCGCASSDDGKIEALEKRVALLEQAQAASAAKAAEPSPIERRVAALEEQAKAQKQTQAQRKFTPQEQAALDKYQALARARMREDSKTYSAKDLDRIEELYQVANKKWNTEEGKESLRKLVADFPKGNRTGCAILYLAQMSEGAEQVELLEKAIADFSDCFYGDGVNVGIYAKYYLAFHYAKLGEKDKALSLAEEIKSQFPDALSHGGKLLVPIIDATLPKALNE